MFFKTIVIREKERKLENISHMWMGSHLEYNQLKDVLKGSGAKQQKKNEPTIAEVNKDWRRLASFMAKEQ